jgi:hypothetical protein
MAIKVYCERNATRPWLTELERQGKIVLVQFPYDGHNRRVRQRATPSVVTADSTYVTCDMMIPINDMVESEKCEQIRRIIGKENEGDARHLDSAYKSGCGAFLTTDKADILQNTAALEPVLGFRLFHPDEDHDRFLAFINA